MPIVPVDSVADPRLDLYRDLKTTNRNRWSGTFIAEGEKLVERLLDSPFEVVSLVAEPSHVERFADRLPAGVPLYEIPPASVEELVGFNFHRGILACGRRKPSPPLAKWLAEHPGRLTLVVCPDVKDPENLGAIIRISSAFGVDGLLLGEQSTDAFSRRVLRVSMGTVFRLPILRSENLLEDLRVLGNAGVERAATVLDPAAESLEKFTRGERFALLFGSEGHGLDAATVDCCDRKVTIPMQPGVDSLNVAVAAGIFLYHLAR